MAAIRPFFTRERMGLVGDALLMTAAAYGVIMGLAALLVTPTGTPEPGREWATALASLLLMGVVVAMPVLVWLMHGRRLSGMAVLGGLVGAFATGFVFMGLAALSAVLAVIVSPFTDSDFGGPIAMLVLVSAAFVGLVLWLAAGAIRDLATGRRSHVGIDILRLISLAILVAFSVGVAMWTADHPGGESGEALVIAMLAGLGGALAVLGADAMTSLSPSAKAPPPTPALTPGGGDPGSPE
jgi:hypothetical protein